MRMRMRINKVNLELENCFHVHQGNWKLSCYEYYLQFNMHIKSTNISRL